MSNVVEMVKQTVGSMSENNPLGLAIGALAVGFLAGLAAPVSELERRTLGPIRDDLVVRAITAVQQTSG